MAMMANRPRERVLLAQVAVLLVLLYAELALHRWRLGHSPVHVTELAALLALLLCYRVVHQLLDQMGTLGDEALLPLAALLTGLGLLLKLRLARSALTAAGLTDLWVYPLALTALVAAVWVCNRRLHWLEWSAWLAGLGGLGLMAWLVGGGSWFRGAMYGPGLTTPSELLKPLMVVFLAGFLKRRPGLLTLLLFLIIWLGVLALVVRQSDLGMVLILSALLLSMFYVSTGRGRYLLAGLAAAAMMAVVLYYAAPLSTAAGRGQQRIVTWLNPWSQPMGAGYQTLQAMFGLRAGGWTGLGLGGGHPRLVPLVGSDFAYAAVAEELGLLGSGLLVVLFVALFRRGFRIATLAVSPFRQRLAIGCVTVLAIQTLINLAGVVRLAPITGITLPFISHGGSSLLVSHTLLGLLIAVGHDVEVEPEGTQGG